MDPRGDAIAHTPDLDLVGAALLEALKLHCGAFDVRGYGRRWADAIRKSLKIQVKRGDTDLVKAPAAKDPRPRRDARSLSIPAAEPRALAMMLRPIRARPVHC